MSAARLSALRLRRSLAGAAIAVLLLAPAAGRAEEPFEPHLVVFGPLARVNEGDHDFRQVVRVMVPADAGRIHLRVFDPDTGGAFDEAKGGYDSAIRFSLFGAGARAVIQRDGDGVPQERVEGTPLGTIDFGTDATADGRWATLFSAEASSGIEAAGGREFMLVVEGLSGNDGNVFDVAVSSSDARNEAIDGARLSTLIPTIQVPAGRDLGEMRFTVPADATAVRVENFDAAGGRITYGGPFRSRVLAASGKNEWRGSDVTLDADEPGGPGSVTATNGSETPNDMTLFVTALDAAGAERPLAVELPIRAVAPNRRPVLSLSVEPLACREIRFSAAGSADPDGGALTYRWKLGADADWVTGETVTQGFAEYGVQAGRLEGFDASGQVASGAAREFSFFVKPPPVAVFEAPGLVAQGAEVAFDGSGSSNPALPEGTEIARYRWDFGDGTVLVQEAGEPGFGRPVHRYDRFGSFTVTLTVTDSSGNPCNEAVATRMISVNAPPVANAGGDRRLTVGETHRFDAALSRDPDGRIVSTLWDFGDGTRASGTVVPHAFHRPGIYRVSLTVLDDTAFDSAKGVDVIEVHVEERANQRPVAEAGGDRTVRAGEAVRMDGGGSTDPDGRILFYSWDFGDGSGGDLPAMEHAWWQPGTYAATLTVRDDGPGGGERAVDTAKITVLPAENRPPVATFPREFAATTWQALRLDASAASDRDGSIIAHRWDFGDGATGLGPVIEHMYRKPGFYEARLDLVDNGLPEPAVVSFPFTVIVADRPNLPPVAAAGPDMAAVAGAEIAFDASASRDPDGSILTHSWDFGDGNTASGIRARHVYQFPGVYTLTLAVADDGPHDRLTATDSVTVTVAPAPNQPPVARAGTDRMVATGEIIELEGRDSSDPDGNVLAWRWSFGDGGASPDAAPRHAFHDPGVYTVELTVTDDGEPAMTSSDTITVTVTTAEARGGQD
ncbi:PKD domain-containing protein [Aquibium microcysteis]|uniref:PKD domain-containing protein n=1 Tax=Aquibium microcysteis TaxID=675281 RepID=UPI00165D01E6|nr:PKD domain-containing protein [Aquibium microcysteis]